MLTENDVVKAVSNKLNAIGYKVVQSLTTNEKGIDIIAQKGDVKLYVEAKGETSSKKTI
jgi:Holliday junction resolvase